MSRRTALAGLCIAMLAMSGCTADRHTPGSAEHRIETWTRTEGFEPSAVSSLTEHMTPVAQGLPNYSWGDATATGWYFADEHSLTAVEPSDGHTRWTVPLVPPPDAAPDSPAIVTAQDRSVYATWTIGTAVPAPREIDFLDPANGRATSSIRLPAGMTPSFVSGDVLVTALRTAAGTNVSGYRIGTGQPVWSIPDAVIPRRVGGQTLVRFDGTVRTIGRIDPATGAVMWRQPVQDEPGAVGEFAVGDTTYIAAGSYLVARDGKTGQRRWLAKLGLDDIVDVYPLGAGAIAVIGATPQSTIGVAVVDTERGTATASAAGASTTGASTAVTIDGHGYAILSPDKGPTVVVDRTGTVASDPDLAGSENAVSGDRLLSLSKGVLTAYSLPALNRQWSKQIPGAQHLGFVLPDAVSIASAKDVSVYRR